MAYVRLPKDLSLVKNKLAFNLTKRQLICFGTAAAIGVPAYVLTRKAIGNSAAMLLMMGTMLPLFFLAMYEKDGQPAERAIRNFVRTHIYWPGTRPYKTENLYATLQKEARAIEAKDIDKGAATARAKGHACKRPAGRGEPQGPAKTAKHRQRQ